MKKRVPRVNVSGRVEDVRSGRNVIARPEATVIATARQSRGGKQSQEVASSRRNVGSRNDLGVLAMTKRKWPRMIGLFFLGLAGLVLITFGVGFYYLKYRLPGEVQTSVAELQSAASELNLPGLEAGSDTGGFQPNVSGFGDVFGLLGDIRGLTRDFSTLALESQALGGSWPELVFGGRGEELIAGLKETRDRIASVYSASERLQGMLGFSPWGTGYIPAQIDIMGVKDFLDNLILWLDSDKPRRVLVLLQNPSELRPGGGFVGSYAEAELRRGSAEKIEVNDINDADRDSSLRIVPPRDLQLITKRWRAADANWFFDFSGSARKTLDLFADGGRYDAVAGVSADVIRDILRITGPVELKNSGLTLTAENFLVELQRQVQTGQAEGSDYPKEVLREFMPLVLDKIVSMDDAAKSEFAAKLGEWTEKKDVQVYFRDSGLQKFFEKLGASGRVFQIPEAWNGDYLAVVFGNVGGGKSDLYMKQKVVLQSQLNSDGTLSNHLVVSRKHSGKESRYWWYQVPNQGHLKVFVPQGAKLAYAKGGAAKKVEPQVNYAKEGYAADPLVSALEESREASAEFPEVENFLESGKKVFETWIKTDLGKTSEIVFDYSRRLPIIPGDGTKYEFVFERQSGAKGEYSFQISAPVGFRFRENNLPVFEYNSSDPPGRLILNLTLEKI